MVKRPSIAFPLAALLVFGAIMLVGCAAGPNPMVNSPTLHGTTPAGFWLGLWHGVISPITFLISLFNLDVHFYEVHNNGGWYNFGFVWGCGIIFGGSRGASRFKPRKRRDDAT
jgi:hypothetical protein